VVVREDFSRSRCDALIADIKLAMETLGKMDEQKIKEHKEQIAKHGTSTGRHKKMNQHFTDEKHSLQGKTGKTHAVC
ncbi:hypothetical protein KCU98_g21180, partial [Aureobasidium melanogenum]